MWLTVSPCCWGLEVADWLCCGENWDSCGCCRELKMRGPVGIWRCKTRAHTQIHQQTKRWRSNRHGYEDEGRDADGVGWCTCKQKAKRTEGKKGRINKAIKQRRATKPLPLSTYQYYKGLWRGLDKQWSTSRLFFFLIQIIYYYSFCHYSLTYIRKGFCPYGTRPILKKVLMMTYAVRYRKTRVRKLRCAVDCAVDSQFITIPQKVQDQDQELDL